MAASGILSITSQKKCFSIRRVLASAILEWVLIFLLFINAIFSFLIFEFACYCELQTPCVLCSRLDHILGKKKFKNPWDLICSKHKLEASSLVLCKAHNKLVDVHGMCETCLFSFATINKSNAETYRLLVGKLGEDSCFGLNKDPLLEELAPRIRLCSCCNAPWIPKGHNQNLMQMTRISFQAAYDKDNLTKTERAGSFRSSHQRISSESDHLSHVRYTELNINSDSESEVLFFEDGYDDASIRSRKINPKEEAGIRSVQMEPRMIIHPDDSYSGKLIDPITELQPPVSVSQVQSASIESNGVTLITPKAAMGNGMEEFHWHKADIKHDPSAYPELISLDDVLPSLITKETPVEASTESKHSSFVDDMSPQFDVKQTLTEASEEGIHNSMGNVPSSSVKASERWARISVDDVLFVDAPEKLIEESTESILTLDGKEAPDQTPKSNKLISLVDVLPSSTGVETPVDGLKESYIPRTEDIWHTALADPEQTFKTSSRAITVSETDSERIPVSGDNSRQVPNLLDLGDAYKLAVGNRGRQLSGVLAEQWTGKDSSRISDDLKLLFSQYSNTRDQSINDASPGASLSPRVPLSPKLSENSEELKNPDAVGMPKLQKIISLERNESGQSLDGITVSEIEGESLVDRLTRQIEHDKKLLSSLYKELEEERNASSVAVNQAMAMITRLQEEKATLQMEALQCIRMMEEQAEYDMEHLQKTNDLLTEREKEILDLEAELEYYRIKYPDEFLEDTVEPLSDMKTEGMKGNSEALRDSVTEMMVTSHKVEESEDKKTVTIKNIFSDIEGERSYILQSLKKLEHKLSLFPNNQLDLANNERVNELMELSSKLGFQLNSIAGENDLSRQNDAAQDHTLSDEKPELIGSENNETFYSGESSPYIPNLDTVANEISDLSERLIALEADRNFLEHSINSIRKGKEGLQFIQEIASHLKELRKIVIRRAEQNIV